MGPSVRNELHRRYAGTWGRRWPQDLNYLPALWREAKAANGIGRDAKKHPNMEQAKRDCLDAMRADDPKPGYGE